MIARKKLSETSKHNSIFFLAIVRHISTSQEFLLANVLYVILALELIFLKIYMSGP